jgi:TRAP-type C4-dicarboxylate transport system permease small subunit
VRRFFSLIAEVTLSIAAAGIAIAVVLNLLQIVFRYVFFDPLAWTEEAMRYLLIWVTMLGIGAGFYRGEETGAGVLGAIRSPAFQRGLHVIRVASVLVFGGFLVWYGLPFGLGARGQVSAAAQIPMIWPNLAFFAGGVLIVALGIGLVVAPPPPDDGAIRPEDAL